MSDHHADNSVEFISQSNYLLPMHNRELYFPNTHPIFCLFYWVNSVTQQEKTVAVLEGHMSPVNCAAFSPHDVSILVTTGDDRTFKVLDIFSSTFRNNVYNTRK